ncbi:MAG TPA: 4-alpha-glucanotransferase [Bryobacteraceae bacterium]|jgi:4-alpha-glucanotransferase|nr:4-alpha-glucanotransferase [Bryobacteraceae bacterium]
METSDQLLGQASSAFGVEPGFWDIWGNYRSTSNDTRQALLASMGVISDTPEHLEAALDRRSRREWECPLPPTLVVSESKPRLLQVGIPAELGQKRADITIRREDGTSIAIQADLRPLPEVAKTELDGRAFVRKQVSLPSDLPLGYHDISIRIGTLTAKTRYIVTPDRAWTHPNLGRTGRAAGITLSLYGVRSARNWGCGDFRDLQVIVDWVAEELHASFVGLNPLHAIHNRKPFNTSPYLPNCIYYQNFIYLDVEGIQDYTRSRRAQRLRWQKETCAELESLRAAPLVEYERVAALKLRFLKLLFVQFLREWRASSLRGQAFREYVAREGDLLERFATYCALDEYLHRQDREVWIWTQWPEEYRDPESPAVRSFRSKHWRSVMFYQYLQWQIDIQLARAQQWARSRQLSIGLYHDLALATDRFGADLWAHRPFFVPDCRVGSPPDDFAPGGQDWGFPPPNSEHHREDGYRLFAESIRKNCRHGGALRIDHVMRLFRLYWIPEHSTAEAGAYVRELSDDYLRVLALESVRNRVLLIGEDLGTVVPEIRESLARFGVLSYRLFYFEQNGGKFRHYEEYPQQALVSSTTHDLPTLAGFWIGIDIEARHQAGKLDDEGRRRQLAARAIEKQKMLDVLFESGMLPPHMSHSADNYPEMTGDLHNAVVGFLALAPSQLLAINQEDLTKELEQQNLPGTTAEYPNWQRKMRFTVEQLRSDPQARSFTEMFGNWIGNSGRANRAGE